MQCPNSQSTCGRHNKIYGERAIDGCVQCWQCSWCHATGCDDPNFTKHWAAVKQETVLMHPQLWNDIVSNDNEQKLRKIIREEVKAALEEWNLLKEIRYIMKHLND